MRRRWGVRAAVLALCGASMLLAMGSSASAQIAVGQVGPPASLVECDYGEESFDELQRSVAAGTSYIVPSSGVITSWSTQVGTAPGQALGMKVYRPLGAGAFLVVGQDGPRPLASGLNTFAINLPVQTGDILGIFLSPNVHSECLSVTGLEADQISWHEGNVSPGGSFTVPSAFPENPYSEVRLNVSASLLPPPVISSITPAEGSIKGASVVIAGANFASVTGVSFGSVPATFAVNSEAQITAVAPLSKTLSAVPVTVTTAAGSATSAQAFAYKGCKVPQLKAKKLKAAKKKIRMGDCGLGKVKKLHEATAKTGKVTKQSPKPGKILAPGSKVKITLDD
jgi:IPT/TIG domain-containing protein/PASTA domain-containing protein